MIWTVEKVKEALPDVPVPFPDGHVAMAKLGGRKLDFAHMVVKIHGAWLDAGEVAWETIARVLNNDRKIKL